MKTDRGPLKNFSFSQYDRMITFQYKSPYLKYLNKGGFVTSCEITDRHMYSESFTEQYIKDVKRIGKFLTTGI